MPNTALTGLSSLNRLRKPGHVVYLMMLIAPLSQLALAADTPEAATPAAQTADASVLQQDYTLDAQTPADSEEQRCQFDLGGEEWIDEFRDSAHSRLCRSARWVDGLFGDEHEFNDADFRGKISIGFKQDEEDGFDPRLRVKIRTKLPNVSSRFNAFVGRVEEDSYISNTEIKQDRLNAVGLRSTNDDDAEWLFGVGYRNPKSRNNGFDYSVGAKLSSGINPYAKATHRHLFTPSSKDYWRTTQTLFWRKDDGLGVSSNLDYTRFLGDRDIFEWDSSVKYTEEAEQWEWFTSTTLHHSFTTLSGISTSAYVRGEEKNEVSIPEFGMTFAYVRPFLRPWLFAEAGIDLRWEKDTDDAEYQAKARIGLQFEMHLGDYNERYRR